MIIFYVITWFLTIITYCNGFSSCSTSSIGFCLRSLFDVWEHVRNVESHASNLLFPVPFYTRQSVLVLCNEYIETKAKCFVDGELGCRQSPMVSFVQSHLDFYCGTHLPIYLENFECISSNLLRNRQCFQSIFGIPNPMNDKDKCKGLPKYFDCVKESLNSSCGTIATTIVGSSIRSFGCELESNALDLSDLKKLNETGKYTQQYLEDFVLLERPANLEDLRKSKEISSEVIQNDNSTEVPVSTITPSTASVPAKTATEPISTTSSTTISTTTSITTSREESAATFQISAEAESFDDSFNGLNDLSDDQPFTFSASMLEDKETITSTEANNITEESTSQTTELQNNPAESAVASSEMLILSNSSLIISGTTANTSEEVIPTTEPTITTTTLAATTTTFDDSEICTPPKEQAINTCFEHVVNEFSGLAAQGEPSTQIRFPLFNISLSGVLSMCKLYDEATKCASRNLQPCYEMQLLQSLSSQLETVCFRINSMKAEYQCMLNSLSENPNCVRFLTSYNNQTKCDYQQEAFDCLQSSIICLEQKQTIILIKEMIRGYGCTVYFKHYLTKPPITLAPTTRRTRRTTTPSPSTTVSTTDDVEGSGESSDYQSTTSSVSSTDEINEDDFPHTDATTSSEITEIVETTTLTTTNIPTTLPLVEQVEEGSVNKNELTDVSETHQGCPKNEMDQVRECMAPLMSTWLRIHTKKPILSEITFPVYSYSPREMLDLCDGYANLFLCAGVTQIKKCLKDDMLEAAQDYLGYQCSPPNLPTFMRYYSCIKSVDSSFGCSRFIRGTVTSTRKRKCDGFPIYVNCMVPLVQSTCGLDAIRQFNFTVSQFGCNRRQG